MSNVVIGLLVLFAGGNLLALIQARFVWSIIVTGLWIWVAVRFLPGASLWPRWHGEAFRRSFSFGVWQNLADAGGMLAMHTDKYVLGIYLSPTAVGLYNIAWSLMVQVYTTVYRMGEVLFPAVSNLQGGKQQQRAGYLMMRASWFLSAFAVAILGPVFVFSNDVLRLYVGAEIANSIDWLLQVLIISVILSSASVAPAQYLLGIGRTKWTAAVAFSSGIVVLLCGLLLVPRFGLLGAGWSQVLMVLLTRPAVHVLLWREFIRPAVSIRVFLAHLYGLILAGISVTIILGFVRSQIVWQPGWLETILGLFACSLVLFLLVFVVDLLLPGGAERRAEATKLARHWVGMSKRIAQGAKIVVR